MSKREQRKVIRNLMAELDAEQASLMIGLMRVELQRRLNEIGYSTLESNLARYEKALKSIADNTCCDKCQEAALVAKEALNNE